MKSLNGRDDGGDDNGGGDEDGGGEDDGGGDVGGEDDDEFLVSKLCTGRSFPLLRQLLLSVIITPPSLISLTAGEKQPELKSKMSTCPKSAVSFIITIAIINVTFTFTSLNLQLLSNPTQ